MKYMNVSKNLFNKCMNDDTWDVNMRIKDVGLFLQTIKASWHGGMLISAVTEKGVNISYIKPKDIYGAYTNDEGEIKSVIVEITDGYLAFRKQGACGYLLKHE